METVEKKPLIYVAGPYTGAEDENTLEAMRIGNKITRLGFLALVPHLSHFFEEHFPRPYEQWMELDFELVRRVDAVLRLKGASSGADREVELAISLGIPVFYSIAELMRWKHART